MSVHRIWCTSNKMLAISSHRDLAWPSVIESQRKRESGKRAVSAGTEMRCYMAATLPEKSTVHVEREKSEKWPEMKNKGWNGTANYCQAFWSPCPRRRTALVWNNYGARRAPATRGADETQSRAPRHVHSAETTSSRSRTAAKTSFSFRMHGQVCADRKDEPRVGALTLQCFFCVVEAVQLNPGSFFASIGPVNCSFVLVVLFCSFIHI